MSTVNEWLSGEGVESYLIRDNCWLSIRDGLAQEYLKMPITEMGSLMGAEGPVLLRVRSQEEAHRELPSGNYQVVAIWDERPWGEDEPCIG